jgi:phage terminase large subunit-like protein
MSLPQIEIDEARLALLPDDQRAELERQLAQLQQIVTANPLQIYQPHGKQQPFHEATTRTKAFFGGNRAGKTTAGIVDDLIQAVDADCLPEHLAGYKKWQPPFYCRIVVPDFTATLDGVIFPKIRDWVPRHQLLKGSWDKAFDKQLRRLMFANGSWFQFMTFEQDIDKFGGAALHRVHFDEEPPEPIWKECGARLIDFGGDQVFTMTPLMGMSWMYDSIYARRDEPKFTIVEADMDDNPHLNEDEKEEYLDGLTDEERKARKSGQFVHFGGIVFPEFNPEIHIVPEDKINPEVIASQKVIVAIDPGLNKTAVSFISFDRDNSALVFDELYLSNATVETAAKAIKDKLADWGTEKGDLVPEMFVIDPSARNRSLVNKDQVQAEYARCGIYCAPAQNAREVGLFQMKRRLQHKTPNGDPQPMLRFSSRCQYLKWEIQRYRKKETRDGSFDAEDGDDHLIDATRYGCMTKPFGPLTGLPSNKRRPRYQHGVMPAWTGDDMTPDSSPMGSMA